LACSHRILCFFCRYSEQQRSTRLALRARHGSGRGAIHAFEIDEVPITIDNRDCDLRVCRDRRRFGRRDHFFSRRCIDTDGPRRRRLTATLSARCTLAALAALRCLSREADRYNDRDDNREYESTLMHYLLLIIPLLHEEGNVAAYYAPSNCPNGCK